LEPLPYVSHALCAYSVASTATAYKYEQVLPIAIIVKPNVRTNRSASAGRLFIKRVLIGDFPFCKSPVAGAMM
jgi:hypothetical protein